MTYLFIDLPCRVNYMALAIRQSKCYWVPINISFHVRFKVTLFQYTEWLQHNLKLLKRVVRLVAILAHLGQSLGDFSDRNVSHVSRRRRKLFACSSSCEPLSQLQIYLTQSILGWGKFKYSCTCMFKWRTHRALFHARDNGQIVKIYWLH